MPIRLLHKKGRPYAYQWGWHGAIYPISKYGNKGAYARAAKQATAAHASGYREAYADRVSRNLIGTVDPKTGSQYDIDYSDRDVTEATPSTYFQIIGYKKGKNSNDNNNYKPY